MGRELQKKKNRSSVGRVRQKPKSKKITNPLGNAIIAANWDSTQTLSQNYRRLGLASKLNAVTGGTEKKATASSTASRLSITTALPTAIAPAIARVERDPETGKILRVIHAPSSKPANPLNDALLTDDEDEFEGFEGGAGESNGVVRELEQQAMMVQPPEKKIRKQSLREQEWCQRLVDVYGDDYKRMVRDRKLNPMQQTEPDIARRIKKFRAEQQ